MRLGSRIAGVPALTAAIALLQTWTEALTFHPTLTVAGPRGGLQHAHRTSNPTSPPYDIHSGLRAQRERRAGGQSEICGWVSGNSVDPVSCQSGYYCATASTFVGCCQQASCIGIITTCYDILGPVCDARCQLNYNNLICSQTGSPYCAQYVYPSGSVGYGCARLSGFTVSVLLSTVSQFGALSISATTSQSSIVSTVSTSATTSASLSTTLAPTPIPTPSSSGNALSGAQIAGITIGAATVLVLIFALIFWRVRRQRRAANMNHPLRGSALPPREISASPAGTYQIQDMRGFDSRISSGPLEFVIKDDLGVDGYHAPGPEGLQAAFPGQMWQYGPVDGGGDGLGSRPIMHQMPYSGPTMPEMVGSRPDPPR